MLLFISSIKVQFFLYYFPLIFFKRRHNNFRREWKHGQYDQPLSCWCYQKPSLAVFAARTQFLKKENLIKALSSQNPPPLTSHPPFLHHFLCHAYTQEPWRVGNLILRPKQAAWLIVNISWCDCLPCREVACRSLSRMSAHSATTSHGAIMTSGGLNHVFGLHLVFTVSNEQRRCFLRLLSYDNFKLK